jgi:hypothetical protein
MMGRRSKKKREKDEEKWRNRLGSCLFALTFCS